MQSIIRVEHDKDRPFLVVSKETVRDKEVSFEARGFLIFLLAKPDDWQIRPEQLAEECGVHPSTIYRLLGKLIKVGYVHRIIIPRRKADGTFDSAALYTVFEDRRASAIYAERVPF